MYRCQRVCDRGRDRECDCGRAGGKGGGGGGACGREPNLNGNCNPGNGLVQMKQRLLGNEAGQNHRVQH